MFLYFFYHPTGPRTPFKKTSSLWIHIKEDFRCLKLTTDTGRSYSVSQKLSEEINCASYQLQRLRKSATHLTIECISLNMLKSNKYLIR